MYQQNKSKTATEIVRETYVINTLHITRKEVFSARYARPSFHICFLAFMCLKRLA